MCVCVQAYACVYDHANKAHTPDKTKTTTRLKGLLPAALRPCALLEISTQTHERYATCTNETEYARAPTKLNTQFNQELDVTGNCLRVTGTSELAAALVSRSSFGVQCSPLRSLLLGRNSIGCGGVVALKAALKGPLSSLQRLALDENDIAATGATALGECLPELTSLHELSLRRNPLGTPAGIALLRGFVCAAAPQMLSPASASDALAADAAPAHQDTGVQGRVAVACEPGGGDARPGAAPGRFREMRVLDLSQCNLQGAATEKAIADALREQPRLQELALQGNHLGGGCVNLCASLRQLASSSCAGLVKLKLGGVGLGSHGAEALADPLSRMKHLLHLGLGRNGLGDAGLLKLMDAFFGLGVLRTLGLQHNDLGPGCSARLAELFLSLRMLQDVRLYGNNLHLGATGIRPLEACRHIITWDTDI